METNTHHILFPRTAWQAHPDLNKIRNWLTIRLPTDVHNELHNMVGYVPPLPVAEAGAIWHKVNALNNTTPMVKLMVLTAVIREAIAHAHDYYVAMSMSLTHEALTAQLDFLHKIGQ